jgi:hypothetical protein
VSFYAPIACQSARPINLPIAWFALALCTQGHSGWARDFECQARLILEIDVGELLPVVTCSSADQDGGKRRGGDILNSYLCAILPAGFGC